MTPFSLKNETQLRQENAAVWALYSAEKEALIRERARIAELEGERDTATRALGEMRAVLVEAKSYMLRKARRNWPGYSDESILAHHQPLRAIDAALSKTEGKG